MQLLHKIRTHNQVLLDIEEERKREKPPSQPKETYAQNYPSRPKSPNTNTSQSDNRSNGLRGRSNSPYVSNGYRSKSNSYSRAVRFEARHDKVNSLYDTLPAVMPFFKIIKSPNQQSEESNDTPHVPTAGMSGQHFYKELFQNAVGDKKNNGLSTQFLIDAGATYSIINSETFTEVNTIQPLVVSPLEKSPLAANGHAMPMKGKTTIQSAFDVEYSCVIEHMVFVSDTPEARMNVLGMDFLAKFDEFINLINPMLILTVLSGKCVKLSPYLDKLFLTFHKLTRWNTSQKKESSGKPRKRK